MDSMQRNEISVQQLDMNNTLAIKLPIMDVPAKACMSLKKLTGFSLGEIKSKAVNDDYLFICDYLDDDGLRLMNKIKREMKKLGIDVRQFEDGVEKSHALFDSIEKLHKEIDDQYGTYEDEFLQSKKFATYHQNGRRLNRRLPFFYRAVLLSCVRRGAFQVGE